jgi:triphosphoribosyl-dephospho-CoA synthetase
MIRTLATAALALSLSAPLAFAGEGMTNAEKRLEEGTKRIQAQKDAIKGYDVADEARPDDRDLVNKLASPSTAAILLRKSVNNSQADEVAEKFDVTVEDATSDKE